jgi:hypothetical protein
MESIGNGQAVVTDQVDDASRGVGQTDRTRDDLTQDHIHVLWTDDPIPDVVQQRQSARALDGDPCLLRQGVDQ